MSIIKKGLEYCHSVARLMSMRYRHYEVANPKIWSVKSSFIEQYVDNLRNFDQPDSFGYISLGSRKKVLGAVFGRIIDPPGVYNPGVTCLIEDFAVGEDRHLPSIFPRMLSRILSDFSHSKIEQFVFVSPTTYTTQQAYFQSLGIYNCSQLWTGQIYSRDHSMVHRLEEQDLDGAVSLSHMKRLKYSTVAPVFWKMMQDSDSVQREFFASMIEQHSKIPTRYYPLVLRTAPSARDIAGLIIGETHKLPDSLGGTKICKVDDFVIENEDSPRQWRVFGIPLLESLSFQMDQGIQFQVVSGSHDEAKLELLRDLGLQHSINWWTTPTYVLGEPFFGESAKCQDIEVVTIGEILE